MARKLSAIMVENTRLEQRHYRLIAFILRCTVVGYKPVETITEGEKKELDKRARFWGYELQSQPGKFTGDKFIKAVVTGEI